MPLSALNSATSLSRPMGISQEEVEHVLSKIYIKCKRGSEPNQEKEINRKKKRSGKRPFYHDSIYLYIYLLFYLFFAFLANIRAFELFLRYSSMDLLRANTKHSLGSAAVK